MNSLLAYLAFEHINHCCLLYHSHWLTIILEYEIRMAQKAQEDKQLDKKLHEEHLKDIKQQQMSEQFRIQAEKNEYKIETLTKLLDQEEQRRNNNAAKMQSQIDTYKRNLEYTNKIEKYQKALQKEYELKQKNMEKMIHEIELKVQNAEKARRDEIQKFQENKKNFEGLTKQNREKLQETHNQKMEKLVKKLKDEEEHYENMKRELGKLRKGIVDSSRAEKLEKVKKHSERIYQTRKENLMIKLHHNEEILKERQRQRERHTEELRK